MLTRAALLGVLVATATLLGLPAFPAAAAGPVACRWEGLKQVCDTVAADPGRPASHRPGGGGGGAASPLLNGVPGSYWSAERGCWVFPLDPQPPAGDPRWQGNTSGAVYVCAVPPSLRPAFFWADSPPPADPEALARQAVDSMELRPPDVGATPLPGPAAVSLIGLPTWLWVQAPDRATWGPVTATATAGAVTVTATARVVGVVWDMGDGRTVACAGPGTAWTPAMGAADSPDCGYRYRTPGPRTITATTSWQVDWAGAGRTGTIAFDLSGSRSIDVVERRAVITG